MTSAPTDDWVLLANTVVRKADIRRIDVNTQFGLICQVYLAHGPVVRVTATDPGAGWLYAQYLAAKEVSSSVVLHEQDADE